ncbi:MAG: zinc-ribbon domain-containing protein [Candidatus Bathyarchaeia archaeon]
MSGYSVRKCASCNVELQFAQKIPFRIKGTPGMWKLLFRELAELGEELLSFDLYVCPKCGEVRFFADEKSMQSLLKITPRQFLKKCVKCGKDIPIASEYCPYCGAEQPKKRS